MCCSQRSCISWSFSWTLTRWRRYRKSLLRTWSPKFQHTILPIDIVNSLVSGAPWSENWKIKCFSFSLNHTSFCERWGTCKCKSIIIKTKPVTVRETLDTPGNCVMWPMSKLLTNLSTLSSDTLSFGNLRSTPRHFILLGSQTSLSALKNEFDFTYKFILSSG